MALDSSLIDPALSKHPAVWSSPRPFMVVRPFFRLRLWSLRKPPLDRCPYSS